MKNLHITQKILLGTFILLFGHLSYGQNDPFVTTWLLEDDDTEVTIPVNLSFTYDYEVDWTYDGTTFMADETNVTGSISHDYESAQEVTIAIRGTFPAIYFNNGGDRNKITGIDQWGDIAWTTMNNAFYGCNELISLGTDAPDLTIVKDMSSMFRDAYKVSGDISAWDVSSVISMSFMFSDARAFNSSLSGWNVSSVVDMSYMFNNAIGFNQSLNGWATDEVMDMSFMFNGAEAFNGTISNWNTSKVRKMNSMFNGAKAFNQAIDAQCISSPVEVLDRKIDKSADPCFGTEYWNVGMVTSMSNMFNGATAFNQSIDNWDVSKVKNMLSMFKGATKFNQDLNMWTPIAVTNMNSMFRGAIAFNGEINNWVVSEVKDMVSMFQEASAFNQALSMWDVSKVPDMTSMFEDAIAFNQDIDAWDVDLVTDMAYMFHGADKFNQDLNSWDVDLVTDMSYMFNEASDFDGDISAWDVSEVTDMNNMFKEASAFNQDIGGWDMDSVKNITSMFSDASAFNQDIGGWDIGSVTSLQSVFVSATSFNQNINAWDVDSVTNMSSLFNGATAFNEPLSDWDVSAVTDMSYMFAGASAFDQAVGGWDVDTVMNMKYMFDEALAFNQALNEWDVSAVEQIEGIFEGAILFNQPLVDWELSEVSEMDYMFAGASTFDQALGGWDVTGVSSMSGMLSNSGLSIANFDTLLNKWAIQNVRSSVSLGANGLRYCDGAVGYNDLISTSHKWIISGASQFCRGEIVITQSADTTITTEDGTMDTIMIALGVLPPSNVVLNVSTTDSGEGTLSLKTMLATGIYDDKNQDKNTGGVSNTVQLTFTPSNYTTSQMVIVTGQSDSDVDGDITYAINAVVVDASSPETYDGLSEAVQVTNQDVPCPDLTTAAPAVSVDNNACASGSMAAIVGVITAPTGTCPTRSTLMYSLDSADWSTTLPTYDQDSILTVYTRCDCDANGQSPPSGDTGSQLNQSNLLKSNGGEPTVINEVSPVTKVVTAPVLCPGIMIAQSADTTITTEGGSTDTIMISLSTVAPASNVVLNVDISDYTEGSISVFASLDPIALGDKTYTKGLDPSGITLTFTSANWDTPQGIIITGVDDSDVDGDITYDLTVATVDASSDDIYDGLSESVKVTNQDDGEPCLMKTPVISSIDVVNSILCGTSADGSITINLSGDDTDVEYSIDNGSNWSSSATFSELDADMYNVLARYNDGTLTCTMATATMTEVKCIFEEGTDLNSQPVPLITGNSVVCEGDLGQYAFIDSVTMCKSITTFDPELMENVISDSCYMTAVIPDASTYEWTTDAPSDGVEVSGDISPSYDMDFGGALDSIVVSLTITDDNGDSYQANKTVYILTQAECAVYKCQQNINIAAAEMIANEVPSLVNMQQYITSTGIVEFGKTFDFRAGSYIELQPDFEVEIGGTFTAQIEGCQNIQVE